MVAFWPTMTVAGVTLRVMLAAGGVTAMGVEGAMYPMLPSPPHAASSAVMAQQEIPRIADARVNSADSWNCFMSVVSL
jgi:hypothetical protein